MCGRGVLLDWVAYAEKHNISYNPVSRQEIPISDLEACAKDQGVQFQVGDILFVRSGFVKWHNNATDEERKAGTKDASKFIGVRADETSFKWHWEHHFSAVVGDTVAWEAWPPSSPMLHEYLLVSRPGPGNMLVMALTNMFRLCLVALLAKCGIWKHWQRSVRRKTDGLSSSQALL